MFGQNTTIKPLLCTHHITISQTFSPQELWCTPFLWAKRLGNGDMMSAQEWLDGRILTKHDMNSKRIIKFLVICTALNTWLIRSLAVGLSPMKILSIFARWKARATRVKMAKTLLNLKRRQRLVPLQQCSQISSIIFLSSVLGSIWLIEILFRLTVVCMMWRESSSRHTFHWHINHIDCLCYGYRNGDLVMDRLLVWAVFG